MSIFFEGDLSDLRASLFRALDSLGPRRKVLVIPPDFTRYHSCAGELTVYAREYYGDHLTHVLPALGTHTPMTDGQIHYMFPGVPREIFHDHDWRRGLASLGEVPAAFISEQSEGELDFSWPVQINHLLMEGGFDLILSIGQVVPHEVAGMAGHNKNLLIGTGGAENIHKSHYLGAVYGMERIMGHADNPVRRVLNYAAERYLAQLPIVHVLTVIGSGGGLFVGDDLECFQKAAHLSLRLNFTLLERPLQKVVVYLSPDEFQSTWLGNKAIYRTRMAIADAGELIVLAPSVRHFGEDPSIDALIRKYGYVGTPAIRQAVRQNPDLAASLSAAAHLIHGSSEGRFTITYCPGGLSQAEIEAAGFRYQPLDAMLKRYDPSKLADGHNVVDGEEIFFISNPALGLWAHRDRFSLSQEDSRACGLARLS
ncbi:MAG TPA: lactate racemase domain-containing protein [Bryobacteraceae bacterium]|jgi:nickel-dependent lactate racemase|nr:lactate racemase domain-containing protein [Bryobacteraceae bacterium]